MPDFVLDHEKTGSVNIKVIGVGGGGCNAVDFCFDRGLSNVEFFVVNSDLQALKRSKCPNRIQIGAERTHGRGCGADPKLGEQCMLDARDMMMETLKNTELVFITSGMGGGTGTGAAPALAQFAKEAGILTVGVVTLPFKFEGSRRSRAAEEGIERLRESCDTMIVVNNNRLLDVVGPRVPLREAFGVADSVLANAVQAISDLIATPCLVNLDFNDVRQIMGGKGGAVMGIGIGKGENRAQEAVKKATSSPLLDKLVIDGATGILVCITGGPDMTLSEIDEAVSAVTEMADPDVDVIFGAGEDESLQDQMRVTLIATGFREEQRLKREAEDKRRNANRGGERASLNAFGLSSQPRPRIPSVETITNLDKQPDVAIPMFDEIEAPAAPVSQSPAKSTLRGAIDAMKEQQDNGNGHGPAPTRANGGIFGTANVEEPHIRVAPSGPSARPAAAAPTNPNVRPAGPASRPSGVMPLPPQAPTRPAAQPRITVEESSPKIPLFDPANAEPVGAADTKGSADLSQPAFLRRRGLFD